MRPVPSLRGLQAFEAVARFGGLAAAGEHLGITPSAVSHRIRGLEDELRIQLLHRNPGGLALTEPGRRYWTAVADAFDLLARATADLMGPDLSRPLTVSLTSSIGVRWLMPRFPRFTARHPEVDIALVSSGRLADLSAGEADLALRYGDGDWEGLCAEPILRVEVTPLCAPPLAEKLRGLPVADALANSTLLRLGGDDWDNWLEAAGAAHARPGRQLRVPDISMGLAAAVRGQGIVLGYSGFADDEVATGDLVAPYDLSVPVSKAYYLVYLEDRLADPRVRAFRDWMVAESAGRVDGATA